MQSSGGGREGGRKGELGREHRDREGLGEDDFEEWNAGRKFREIAAEVLPFLPLRCAARDRDEEE